MVLVTTETQHPARRSAGFAAALILGLMCALVATATAAAPTATTGGATGVTANSATVSGTVNPNGEATTYSFQFGTTAAYGLQTNAQSAGSGTQPQDVSATLTGLTAGTTYHYRLIATNASGTTVDTDATFTTSGAAPPPPKSPPPAVTTRTAVGVGKTRATVRGTVNPRGARTTYYFEYGVTTAYGAQSNPRTLSTGNSARAVSGTLTGLQAGTTYHYRLVARNANGLSVGADRTFTIPAASPVGSVPRLTSSVSPSRDRRRPFRFTVRGALTRPTGVSRSSGCRGRVTIRFKAGRKTVRVRRARVKSNCRYRTRLLVRVRRTPRVLRVSVRFGGNAALTSARAPTRKVRAG